MEAALPLTDDLLSPSLHSSISLRPLLNICTVPSHTDRWHHGHYQWGGITKAPLLNVNCRSSHFLITLILNDVLWAPLTVFPFILRMALKKPLSYTAFTYCLYDEVKRNCFHVILSVMQMEDIGLFSEKTVESLFHSVENINGVRNEHMHECECGMILIGFFKDTAHFITYSAGVKCNGQHH